jgi:hypothetical protein
MFLITRNNALPAHHGLDQLVDYIFSGAKWFVDAAGLSHQGVGQLLSVTRASRADAHRLYFQSRPGPN